MSLEDMSRAAVWRRDRLPEENKRTLRKQNLIAAYKRQHLWDLLTIDVSDHSRRLGGSTHARSSLVRALSTRSQSPDHGSSPSTVLQPEA